MPKSKLNIVVLMGGKSAEYEVSLSTGQEVISNLDRKKYNVTKVVMSKSGNNFQIPNNTDVVFIAMHGPYGEDGSIQGYLELLGIPYTGSKVLASAIGMNKQYSRIIFTQNKLKVPKGVSINKGESLNIIKGLKYPLFVKPSNQGSSVGVSKVESKAGLAAALKNAYAYSETAIVDEYIEGMEITCAILGSKKPIALPLVEIVPKHRFFDYEAKYTENLTEEICPARISKSLAKKAQEAALIAYKGIGCEGFGRVDMIVKGKDIYILEVNTIPGLTPVSLFPKAAKQAGISYNNLLDKLISFALQPNP